MSQVAEFQEAQQSLQDVINAYETASYCSIADLRNINTRLRVEKLMSNIAKDDYSTFAKIIGVIKECKDEEEREAYLDEMSDILYPGTEKDLLHKAAERVIFQRDLKFLRCLLETSFPLYHLDERNRTAATCILQRIDQQYISEFLSRNPKNIDSLEKVKEIKLALDAMKIFGKAGIDVWHQE